MNVESARTLFAYNRWANRRLLQAASEVSAEELDRDVRGSFSSLKGTLRHLLWGERSWLRQWKERSFGNDLQPDEFPDLSAIRESWDALERDQDAFFRELTEERLGGPWSVDENTYALSELIQHMVNHSTHHRGQVVLMLRQLGRTPPGTGFRQFLTERRRGR